MARARIFHVAYDTSLLNVRNEMLKHAGFQVFSVLGNTQARLVLEGQADYDLVVIGWSGSYSERREIVRWVKERSPKLRVIALYSNGGQEIAEADFNSHSEKPEEWFAAVKRAAAG
jgi:DNA-binding NtrC family response regulator